MERSDSVVECLVMYEIEGLLVRALSAALCCVLEQDTIIPAEAK